MDENKRKQIITIVNGLGKPGWSIINEILTDNDFKSELLTQQQAGIIKSIDDSPHIIKSYTSYLPDIISKYHGWKLHKDSGLNILEKKVAALSDRVVSSNKDLDSIEKIAKLSSGATVLVSYAEKFYTTSNEHRAQARREYRKWLISIVSVLLLIGLVFFADINEFPIIKNKLADDLKLPWNSGFLILKVVLLIIVFQITQFLRKNYNAEKHLQEIYNHRGNVLQSLHAVYLALDDKVERDRIISAGALAAYERGETGYISTKEGAGSGESILETLVNKNLG